MSAREWWVGGERALGTALGRLVPHEYAEPSLLPGWTRAHVLGHLAGNADALTNLLTWARTGVETPMYASPEARDAEIDRRAALPPAELEAEVLAAEDEVEHDQVRGASLDLVEPERNGTERDAVAFVFQQLAEEGENVRRIVDRQEVALPGFDKYRRPPRPRPVGARPCPRGRRDRTCRAR